jgi:phosphate acetyltransferase
VLQRAAATPRRIVFPESADARTLAAVAALHGRAIVRPILVLDPADPASHDAARALGVEIVDPSADARSEAVAAELLRRRGKKGMTPDEATRLSRTPLYFADGLVSLVHADGCVAGAVNTTGDVMRAAFFLIGPAAGVRTVSSAFYMVVPPFREDAPAGDPPVHQRP